MQPIPNTYRISIHVTQKAEGEDVKGSEVCSNE